jgi:hypothetical protein
LYLAEHHRLKKNEGVLDGFNLDLTPEEEELVRQGKLPEMNLLGSSSSNLFSTTNPNPTPSAGPATAGDMTPPDIFDGMQGREEEEKGDKQNRLFFFVFFFCFCLLIFGLAPPPDKDPLEGMDDVQKYAFIHYF